MVTSQLQIITMWSRIKVSAQLKQRYHTVALLNVKSHRETSNIIRVSVGIITPLRNQTLLTNDLRRITSTVVLLRSIFAKYSSYMTRTHRSVIKIHDLWTKACTLAHQTFNLWFKRRQSVGVLNEILIRAHKRPKYCEPWFVGNYVEDRQE